MTNSSVLIKISQLLKRYLNKLNNHFNHSLHLLSQAGPFGLIGNPVKVRGYPRSCKLINMMPIIYATVTFMIMGRLWALSKPEDLPA